MVRRLITLEPRTVLWRWLDEQQRTPAMPTRLIDALIEDEMLSLSARRGVGSAPLDPREFDLATRAARLFGDRGPRSATSVRVTGLVAGR
jgi:hypothetical protein